MDVKYYLRRIFNKLHIGLPLTNVLNANNSQSCLLVYVQDPFFKINVNSSHQAYLQILELVKIMDELGYNVDVINYQSEKVLLTKQYDAVFDICVKEKPVYRKKLKADARKIVYFTGSESEFANNAELERIKNVEKRRGAKIQPRRQAYPILKEVENYDEAILIGNEYTLATYRGFKLQRPHVVPNTGYDFGDRFDITKRKTNNFLYFGSVGCVHKGLDLLLEVFAEKDFPCNLYVCGNFENEKDFRDEYERELYHTSNIKPVGFIDIWSDKFAEICSECSYTILPSCAEGMAGTICTCMSAGLIPICSKICGYAENPEVITLSNCSKDCIRQTVLEYAGKELDWIQEQSQKVLMLTKEKYSIAAFTEAMKAALSEVL